MLFGPNNAGKTNTLEALASILSDGPAVRPRADGRQAWASGDFLVVLDGRDLPQHEDNRILRSLLYFAEATPTFVDEDIERIRQMRWIEVEADFGEDDLEVARSRPRFNLPPDPRGWYPELPLSGLGEPASVDVALKSIQQQIVTLAQDRVANWASAASAFECVLDFCLASRWLLVRVPHDGIGWVVPPLPQDDSDLAAAVEVLAGLRGDFEGEVPILQPGIDRHARSGGGWVEFCELTGYEGGQYLKFRPFQVVQVTT